MLMWWWEGEPTILFLWVCLGGSAFFWFIMHNSIRELTWQHVSSMYCKVIMSKGWIGDALWIGGRWLAVYRMKFVEVSTWLWGPCASIHRYMFIMFANLLVTFSVHIILLEWLASCCCSCMLCLTEVLHLYGFAKVFMQHVIQLPCFFLHTCNVYIF